MAVRSQLLFATESIGGGAVTYYTTPTGHRTILKSLIVTNLDSTARTVIFYLFNGSTEEASFNVHLAASGTAGDTEILSPWAVIPEGWSIKAQNTGGTARAWASGAELLL